MAVTVVKLVVGDGWGMRWFEEQQPTSTTKALSTHAPATVSVSTTIVSSKLWHTYSSTTGVCVEEELREGEKLQQATKSLRSAPSAVLSVSSCTVLSV